LFILVCFLLGGALAVLTARILGAFDRRAPTAQQYVDRANAAVAVNAWDAPPGENVRDITDLALRRFPGSQPVLAVRHDAAQILVRRARAARDSDVAEAQHLARLAHELDPSNAEVEQLYTELSTPAATVAEQPSPPNASATPSPVAPRVRNRKDEPRAAPVPSAGAPPGASAAPAPPPESGRESGRWL
jgi:serine/threonine-protein kinase